MSQPTITEQALSVIIILSVAFGGACVGWCAHEVWIASERRRRERSIRRAASLGIALVEAGTARALTGA